MLRQNKVFLRSKIQKFWLAFAKKRYIFLVSLCLITLLGIVGVDHFNKRSPMTACRSWGFAKASAQVFYTHPEKIVVEPWKGPHHVYGVFQIPGGYLNERLFTVAIPGERVFCGVSSFQGTKSFAGIQAQPGNYLMKGMLNTRVALWLISQGKASELGQAKYWKLGYVQKSS